jgi:hypothetical protein
MITNKMIMEEEFINFKQRVKDITSDKLPYDDYNNLLNHIYNLENEVLEMLDKK